MRPDVLREGERQRHAVPLLGAHPGAAHQVGPRGGAPHGMHPHSATVDALGHDQESQDVALLTLLEVQLQPV